MKIYWVDTKKQLADILTKKGVSPLPLLTVLSEGHLLISDFGCCIETVISGFQ